MHHRTLIPSGRRACRVLAARGRLRLELVELVHLRPPTNPGPTDPRSPTSGQVRPLPALARSDAARAQPDIYACERVHRCALRRSTIAGVPVGVQGLRAPAAPMAKLVAVLVVSALAIAGCGSSTPSSKPWAGSAALKFARCMRAHGMPNFPDPTSSGALNVAANPSSPAFRAAQPACGPLPAGFSGIPRPASEAQKLVMLRLAQCMRAHGIPNFPDPVTTPPKGVKATIFQDGLYFGMPSTIDHHAPAFIHATTACGLRLS